MSSYRFCDWQLEKTNTIWCETDSKGAPYDELPVIPVDFSQKDMTGTVYEDDYREEHLQNVVDNLNLLYVAFTRAGENLVVIGKRKNPKAKKGKDAKATGSNRSELLENCLKKVAEECGAELVIPDDDKEPIEFRYGEMYVNRDNEDKEKKDNVFEQAPESRKINLQLRPEPQDLRLQAEQRQL